MVIVILEGTCGVDWSNGGQGLTRSCREITLAASKLSPLGQVPSQQEKTGRSSCCLKAKKGFLSNMKTSQPLKEKNYCRKQNKGKCELGQLREGRKLRGIYSFSADGRAGVEHGAGQQRQAVSDSRRGKGQQLLRRVRAAWTAQIWEEMRGDCKQCLHRTGEDLDGMSGRKLKKLSCGMSQKWEEPSQLRASNPVSLPVFSKIWLSGSEQSSEQPPGLFTSKPGVVLSEAALSKDSVNSSSKGR